MSLVFMYLLLLKSSKHHCSICKSKKSNLPSTVISKQCIVLSSQDTSAELMVTNGIEYLFEISS